MEGFTALESWPPHSAESAALGRSFSFPETSPPLPWEACGGVTADEQPVLGGGRCGEQSSREGEQCWLQPLPTSAPWGGEQPCGTSPCTMVPATLQEAAEGRSTSQGWRVKVHKDQTGAREEEFSDLSSEFGQEHKVLRESHETQQGFIFRTLSSDGKCQALGCYKGAGQIQLPACPPGLQALRSQC